MSNDPAPDSDVGLAAEPPAWDPTDLPGSVSRYSAWFAQRARMMFLKDGFHTEMFFFLQPDGTVHLGHPPAGMDREKVAEVARQTIRANDVCGVIHICEAWMCVPKYPKDHTFTQVLQGEMAVSDLRPEDRTEVLTVRVESRDGASHMWLSPIVRLPNGVALSDPIDWPHPPGGTFGRLFDE